MPARFTTALRRANWRLALARQGFKLKQRHGGLGSSSSSSSSSSDRRRYCPLRATNRMRMRMQNAKNLAKRR
jgi:hypothetical protein